MNSYAVGRRRHIRSNAAGIVSTCMEKDKIEEKEKKYSRPFPILCPRRRTLGASSHSVGIYSHAPYSHASLTLCAVLCLTLGGGCSHKAANEDTLGGKWVGKIIWNDASGRPYQQTMRTALFFLPRNRAGIVITFPTGAIGGAGSYTLEGSRLIVRCESLSVNGRSLPPGTFVEAPWYRSTASYTVSYHNGNLVLTPAAPGPTPAPCWPLLVSPKPLVLSRMEPPQEDVPAAPPPRE